MTDISVIKKDLLNTLSSFRYKHSIEVAEFAKELARRYNYDENKAYLAGLVHDIAKEFSEEENIRVIKENNLDDNLLNNNYRNILHADIGAIVVKERYGLDDEICKAVKYHAIGHYPMSLLESIIFISDKLARRNKETEIDDLIELAYKDINLALLGILEKQKVILENKGLKFHSKTLELYNYLVEYQRKNDK